jgi:site-specific DNA-methyltransferase (adenine-specific)
MQKTLRIALNSLYLGDCIENMQLLPDKSINMVLCDLPYGTTQNSWDILIPFESLWKEWNRVCTGRVVLFGVQPFTTDIIMSNRQAFQYSMVWKKNVPTGMLQAKTRPMRYHEDILVFNKGPYNPIMQERQGKGKACYNYTHYAGKSNHYSVDKIEKHYDPDKVLPGTVLEFNVVPNRSKKLHPTQKPVDLCKWLIKTYSNEQDVVLDCCMGSGTTGEAALQTNRKFIGIEKDPVYFDISVKRVYGT